MFFFEKRTSFCEFSGQYSKTNDVSFIFWWWWWCLWSSPEADPRQAQIAGSLANGLMLWAVPETPSSWARALSSLKKRRSSTLAYHIYPMLREFCAAEMSKSTHGAVSQILGIWNPWMCDVGNIWNTCHLSWWEISAGWWWWWFFWQNPSPSACLSLEWLEACVFLSTVLTIGRLRLPPVTSHATWKYVRYPPR